VSGWTYALDTEGPRNGDVIVRTEKGSLVAVIYAAKTESETLRRAQSFCRAAAPQHCSTCGIDTEEGDACASCLAFWAHRAALEEAEAALASQVQA
jgi:hypothetical protein